MFSLQRRKIKKLHNLDLYIKEYIDLLPLVNLHDFVLKRFYVIFRDDEFLYPSRNVRLSSKRFQSRK